MKRRHAFSLALGGLAVTPGCRKSDESPATPVMGEASPVSPTSEEGPDHLEGCDLTPVRIESNLEIRTVVGLRPFRPSGFLVRRDERGGKTVIHNFGHGGGGMSLSWGTSHLATRLAGPLAGASCAVVGGGVMGLSTARLLQLHGAEVTLYTRDLPPETTSNIAGAQWWPVSVFSWRQLTDAFGDQFVEAANFSYRYFQNLVGPQWGVRWIGNYYLSDGQPDNDWLSGPGSVLHHLQIGFRDFGPGEHIFPAQHVRRFHTMLIEPATYLNRLLREVQGGGAKIGIRNFTSEEEVLQLPESLIFNCSGLGAKELFGDGELIPIRGQLSVMIPQPEVQYNLIKNHFYMFPRPDGVILGGTYHRGRTDLAPDPAHRKRIIDSHRAIFNQMTKNIHSWRNPPVEGST